MMIALARFARSFFREEKGTMVIETAIVAPVLAMMAIGGFEASRIVARQTELQTAAAEAAAIVRAKPPETATERSTIKSILRASTGLTDGEVSVETRFRCGTATTLVTAVTSCSTGDAVSSYVRIVMTDTYSPNWTQFGIGEDIDYRVERMVFIK